MATFTPHLMSAKNAAERMDALEEFIQFWLGDPQPEYGVAPEKLDAVPLPATLRRFYQFAGAWPAASQNEETQLTPNAFSVYDRIRPIGSLQHDSSGKIEFLDENQGCWVCRTLADGDDPPVWCEGDLYDQKGNLLEGEQLISESLSEFLVSHALQELTLGASNLILDESLIKKFKAARKNKLPLWTERPRANWRPSKFYLWNDCLIADLSWCEWHFAAKDSVGLEFLESKQAIVAKLQIVFGNHWHVDIENDGSAMVRYRDYPTHEKSIAPPGTLDLAQIYASIEKRLKRSGDDLQDVVMYVYHQGQDVARAQYLSDEPLFWELSRRVHEAATEKSPDIERRLRQLEA